MKKLLTILAVFLSVSPSFFFVFAAQSVQVTAIVGSINHSPVVLTITPSSDPKLLGRNKIQNYTIYFRDDEKDTAYYTLTPVAGFTNPISGTISPASYDSQSGAFITFTYLSPATIPSPNPTTLTVTLNDGPNLVNKDIHLQIF